MNTSNHASIIAELEAEGYQVYPPRNPQSEWENRVGQLLQTFNSIERQFVLDELEMSDRSRSTLDFIQAHIAEMLGANEESEAA
jgi:hypothetical protein